MKFLHIDNNFYIAKLVFRKYGDELILSDMDAEDLMNNDYEINLEMIVFKKYIKLRFRAGMILLTFHLHCLKLKENYLKIKKMIIKYRRYLC